MICPLCEHQQDFGLECDVCGKELGGLGELGLPPVQLEHVEGLEATAAQGVGEVALEKVTGLEIAVLPQEKNAVAQTTLTCRYCKRQQPPGRFCDSCGMTLSATAPARLQKKVASEKTRCRFCGAPAQTGERCGDCGREVPYPEA